MLIDFPPWKSAINALEIAGFRHGLLFEVEQRRRLERKHGKGALQDIVQREAGIAGPVVGDRLKLSVQKTHESVKPKLLL